MNFKNGATIIKLNATVANLNVWETLFVKRVLRRLFGSKCEEAKGGYRKLHNQELHNLYSSPNIIRIKISGE
jgi:hypothetical protein